MKRLLALSLVLSSVIPAAFAEAQETICKTGDFNNCVHLLKTKSKAADFPATYDQVCSENKGFKCVKITIRGEPKEELAYQKTQYPKAQLFLTKVGGEDKIYVIEPREGYKAPVPKKIVEKRTVEKHTIEKKQKVETKGADSIDGIESKEVEVIDPMAPDTSTEAN